MDPHITAFLNALNILFLVLLCVICPYFLTYQTVCLSVFDRLTIKTKDITTNNIVSLCFESFWTPLTFDALWTVLIERGWYTILKSTSYMESCLTIETFHNIWVSTKAKTNRARLTFLTDKFEYITALMESSLLFRFFITILMKKYLAVETSYVLKRTQDHITKSTSCCLCTLNFVMI